MIVDLVSPWMAAVEASDTVRARQEFRARHAPLLDLIRQQRVPHLTELPLSDDRPSLRLIRERATDPGTFATLTDTVARASAHGADGCQSVILLPAGAGDAPAEALPGLGGTVVAFIAADPLSDADLVAILLAIASLTRWERVHRWSGAWNRWEAARDYPLREWIYNAGLGLHLALSVLAIEAHQAMALSRTTFARLRQQEKVLMARIDGDLDQRGTGLVMRWLVPSAPRSLRTVDGVTLPPMAGHYLAWRLVSPRVARAGLRDAMLLGA
ncbi:MAG TPA: hypothetical protein VGM20_06535 [Gemmatimonadales bacterium]